MNDVEQLLYEMLMEHCSCDCSSFGVRGNHYDSMGLSTDADVIRYFKSIGILKILYDDGTRVLAIDNREWKKI